MSAEMRKRAEAYEASERLIVLDLLIDSDPDSATRAMNLLDGIRERKAEREAMTSHAFQGTSSTGLTSTGCWQASGGPARATCLRPADDKIHAEGAQ